MVAQLVVVVAVVNVVVVVVVLTRSEFRPGRIERKNEVEDGECCCCVAV